MNLEYKLEARLLAIEKKLIKSKQALFYLQEILHKIKNLVKDEVVKQIYIRKELEVKNIELLIKKYSFELSVYIKHKAIITQNQKSMHKVFALLDELNHRIVDTIATLQSMSIYLGHSDYIN